MRLGKDVVRCVYAGMTGPALFVAATLFMHGVQPELSVLNDAVSYYMNGPFGWVLGFGLIAIGTGSLALWLAVRRVHLKSAAGQAALVVWAIGAIVGGIFPPDPRGVVGQTAVNFRDDSRQHGDGRAAGASGCGAAAFEANRSHIGLARHPTGIAGARDCQSGDGGDLLRLSGACLRRRPAISARPLGTSAPPRIRSLAHGSCARSSRLPETGGTLGAVNAGCLIQDGGRGKSDETKTPLPKFTRRTYWRFDGRVVIVRLECQREFTVLEGSR